MEKLNSKQHETFIQNFIKLYGFIDNCYYTAGFVVV